MLNLKKGLPTVLIVSVIGLALHSIPHLRPAISQEVSQDNDLIVIALDAVREHGGGGGRRREIIAENDDLENPQHSDVTITGEGLADDSVRGYRYNLQLKKNAKGTWVVVDVEKSWICQPGRGSQVYSQELCH